MITPLLIIALMLAALWLDKASHNSRYEAWTGLCVNAVLFLLGAVIIGSF